MSWLLAITVIVIVLILILIFVGIYFHFKPDSTNSENDSVEESDQEDFPEALHEVCITRCVKGKVCDFGHCKQDIGQPCSQNIDCARGVKCTNWTCGGSEEIKPEEEPSRSTRNKSVRIKTEEID